ncbi:hypothetical protein [Paraburkholderia sp. J63]|uniref:hypothetical protein n=1 Tax=Paraburkholderia sp. J63 TaxID=2805434 RepID=UPI002ABD1AD4|nr:hypothetical protein [Paraburkholderia sp. J63]
MNTNHHLTRHALALRLHLAHDNERLRDALHLIADMAETSADPKSLPTIGRIARVALVEAQPVNPAEESTP